MTTFRIDDKIEIVCESKKTRMAFKHVATLLINGIDREDAKICYQNRTWERYEYESVLEKLVDHSKALTSDQKTICREYIKNYDERDSSMLRTTAMVAKMGEILAPDQKSRNDWKARMLKAGLENSGLIMPENWNELSEDEKERRLNGAIKMLQQ